MKQSKNSIFERILAFVLVVMILVPIFTLLIPINALADESSDPQNTTPTVSLEWGDGVVKDSDGVALPYKSGATDSDVTYDMPFKVVLNGTVTHTVKVTVETFDLSATAGQDYASVAITFELTEDKKTDSGTVTVLQQRSLRIVDGAPVTDDDGEYVTDLAYVTRIKTTGEMFTEQFGLRITNVENAEHQAGKDTLRSKVLAECSDHVLNVVKNNYGVNYGCNDDLFQTFPEGYVYDGLERAYTYEGFAELTEINEKSSKSVQIKSDTETYLPAIKTAKTNNATLSRLIDNLRSRDMELETWMAAWGLMDDDKNGDRWGYDAGIYESYTDESGYHSGAILYKEDYDTYNWNNTPFELEPKSIDKSEAAYSRYKSKQGYNSVKIRSDARYQFVIFNYEDEVFNQSEKDAILSYSAILVNREALVVESFSLEDRAYGAGDTVYLTLKFNKPVQISGSSPLSIQAGIEESNAKYIDFEYCGGSMTDTLIFKTTLTVENTGYFGNYFKLLGFNNEAAYKNSKGGGQIADLFWNTLNKNNSWTPVDEMVENTNLSCKIDTRTPEISNASSVPDDVRTSVSFTTSVSKITNDGSIWISWTESETPPVGDGWERVPYSLVNDKATVTLSKSGASGIFYAHVKAISVSGAQTIRTFGPVKLDNLAPRISNVQLYNIIQDSLPTKTKKLGFIIEDQLPWEGESGIPFSKVYVRIIDTATGGNGLYSKLLDKTDGYYDNVTLDADGNLLIYESGKTNNLLTLEPKSDNKLFQAYLMLSCVEESGTMKLINLDEASQSAGEEEIKESGTFNIGFYVIDKLGNKSDLTFSSNYSRPNYRFDTRNTFELGVNYKKTYWYPFLVDPTLNGAASDYRNGKTHYWMNSFVDNTPGVQTKTWANHQEAQDDYEDYPKNTAPDGTPIFYKEDLFNYFGCENATEVSGTDYYTHKYTGDVYKYLLLTGAEEVGNSGTKPISFKLNGVEQEVFIANSNLNNPNISIKYKYQMIDGQKVYGYKFVYGDSYPDEKKSLVQYWGGTLLIPENMEGYIEIQLGNDSKVSTVYSFFLLSRESESETDNYKALYAEDRLMKNEVWELSTSKFYSGNNRNGVNYNAKGVTPIFSNKEIALEYAKFFEKQDIAIEYIDDEVEASKLENGTYSNYRKAEADKNIPAKKGQTWLRYKSIDWTLGSNNEEQWVYYYYSDEKVESIKTQLTYNLNSAIERNAKLICNYDGDNRIYLTANNVSKGYINKFGEPQYESYGILSETVTYRGVYDSDIVCGVDFALYDSFINYPLAGYGGQGDVRVPIVSNYEFKINADVNAYVLIRQHNAETEPWTQVFDGDNLKDLIEASGLYEIFECSAGTRKYLVYVDVDAPVISYQLTVDNNNKSGNITASSSGGTLRASNFKVTGIVTSANANDSLSVEWDKWAYFYVTNATGIGSGKISAFMTAQELNAKGCTLETGIYKMYAYDRLGNMTVQEIKINTNVLEITHSINTKGLTVNINRDAKDILSGSFKVSRNNVPLNNVNYAKSLQFTRSGVYRVQLTDIYGNSISKEITFNRDLPSVTFSRQKNPGSGVYEPIVINSTSQNALSTVVTDDYKLYTVSTSANMRISYPSGSGYAFEFVGTVPTYGTGGVTTKYIDIDSTENNWVLKIFHQEDPDVYILITCIVDKKAPEFSGIVHANEYEYNEFKPAPDNGNVLFTPTSNVTSVNLYDKDVVIGDQVVVSWVDETKVTDISYRLNGGESKVIDGSIGSYLITEAGKYQFVASDMFGNTSSFEFTLVDHVDFTFEVGGVEQEVDYDPSGKIVNGNVYTETLYTGKDAKLLLKENAMFALYYTNGNSSYVYNIEFRVEQGNAILSVGSDYNAKNDNFESTNQINLVTASSGSVFGESVAVKLNYQYLNGVLTLTVSECSVGYELWQIRISDLNGHSPVVIQMERSNITPEMELVREDGNRLDLSYGGFVGSNQILCLDQSSVSAHTTEIVAYYSAVYTDNYANAEKLVLFGEMANPYIEKEGYYKIVALNKYGNEKIVYLAVSFVLSLDVHIEYEQMDKRIQTLNKPDTYSIYSNKSVSMVIWDMRATVICTKNGDAFTVNTTEQNGYLSFDLTDIGEYKVKINDECGNSYVINVSVAEPRTLTYGNFITGFNGNALKKDQNYTNGTLSLDRTNIDAIGVRYVAFRKVGTTDLTVLYDVISINQIGYSEALFNNSIGTEDGDYEVLFCDYYGNLHVETVRISRQIMLGIERQTQEITEATSYDFDFALENGAWSNYILNFINSSENYVLKVDGQAVSFVDGKYTFTLPAKLGVAEQSYILEYVDDYGNGCTINVYLYRNVPVSSVAEGADMVTSGGTLYARSDFSMNWEGNLYATYSHNGAAAVLFEKDKVFTEDGEYTLLFTDYAGNVSTRIIVKDATVLYDMVSDGFVMNNRVVVSDKIMISPDEEVNFTATRNGEEYTPKYRTFTEDGHYVVTVTDRIGNVSTFEFTIYAKSRQKFKFTAPEGYSFSQIWFVVDGHRVSLTSDVFLDENGSQGFMFTQDGSYELEMLHIESNRINTFALEIDNTPPEISVIGATNGATTRENVTIEGLKDGDKIYVYKNGQHVTTYTVSGDTHNVLELLGNSDFGEYSVTVEDEAGNSVSCEFVKEFATNTFSNIFICILLVSLGAIGIIYIRYNGKVRTK